MWHENTVLDSSVHGKLVCLKLHFSIVLDWSLFVSDINLNLSISVTYFFFIYIYI